MQKILKTMQTIEVEIRSFLTEQQYNNLIDYFKKNPEASLISKDNQETIYFDCPQDLRIQKNNFFSKIWLKKDALHSEAREEIEIKTTPENFDNLKKLFSELEYKEEIKWLRKRLTFQWKNDIKVMLDHTKGYGYIIELEKMSTPEKQDSALEELKQSLSDLNIKLTSKEEFNKAFQNYKENWRNLIS